MQTHTHTHERECIEQNWKEQNWMLSDFYIEIFPNQYLMLKSIKCLILYAQASCIFNTIRKAIQWNIVVNRFQWMNQRPANNRSTAGAWMALLSIIGTVSLTSRGSLARGMCVCVCVSPSALVSTDSCNTYEHLIVLMSTFMWFDLLLLSYGIPKDNKRNGMTSVIGLVFAPMHCACLWVSVSVMRLKWPLTRADIWGGKTSCSNFCQFYPKIFVFHGGRQHKIVSHLLTRALWPKFNTCSKQNQKKKKMYNHERMIIDKMQSKIQFFSVSLSADRFYTSKIGYRMW